MICVSIQNKSLQQIETLLDSGDVEMAEIRIDRSPSLTDAEIKALFSRRDVTLLATCRIESDITAQQAEHKLGLAIEAGAALVDVEIEAPDDMGERIRQKALRHGCRLIRSIHYFDGTPSIESLKKAEQQCVALGAETVKIVTYAHSAADVECVMKLYTPENRGRITAFCMGEAGRESRLEALRRGAPFTYAALNQVECTADGQWTASEMRDVLYTGLKPWRRGKVQVPASKSMVQRAIMAATLSEGVSILKNYSPCSDSESAIRLAKVLGAKVSREADTLHIEGIGASANIPEEVFTGESGFLTRVTIPIISMLHKGITAIKGEGTLVGRPLLYAKETMEPFGVKLYNAEDRCSEVVSVPLSIEGNLCAGKARVSGKGGSQLISGLMAALPIAKASSEITIENPRSIPYLQLTADVLKLFGINTTMQEQGGTIKITIEGGQKYHPSDIDLESDWSGAAPMLIAGAIYGSATVPGLDITSTQADKAIVDILKLAGATLHIDNGEVTTAKSALHSFEADLNQAPDLFPVVAVLAALSEGISRISGVGRLSSKESDRASAIMDMFEGLGVTARIEADTLIVNGISLSHRCATSQKFKGGNFSSRHDHRMVMALLLCSMAADAEIKIDDTECVAKSFPDFIARFNS